MVARQYKYALLIFWFYWPLVWIRKSALCDRWYEHSKSFRAIDCQGLAFLLQLGQGDVSPGEYQPCWRHGDCSSARWHWTYSITLQKVNTSLKSGSAMTEANFHESLLCDIVNINIRARNGYEAVGNDNESLNDPLLSYWEFWFTQPLGMTSHEWDSF